VKGVFPLVDTHGIGLELVVDRMRDQGMMPDWFDFYDSAVKAGWKPARVVTKLAEAVGDVYGREFREEWERRFRLILSAREAVPGA
jgi:alanyl-tRNA synthetase